MWNKVVWVVARFLADLGLVEIKKKPPEPVVPPAPPPKTVTTKVSGGIRTTWDTTDNEVLLARYLRDKAQNPGLICEHCKTIVDAAGKIHLVNEPLLGWSWRCPTCHHPNKIDLRRG